MYCHSASINFINGIGTFNITGFSNVATIVASPYDADFCVIGAISEGDSESRKVTIKIINRDGSQINSIQYVSIIIIGT